MIFEKLAQGRKQHRPMADRFWNFFLEKEEGDSTEAEDRYWHEVTKAFATLFLGLSPDREWDVREMLVAICKEGSGWDNDSEFVYRDDRKEKDFEFDQDTNWKDVHLLLESKDGRCVEMNGTSLIYDPFDDVKIMCSFERAGKDNLVFVVGVDADEDTIKYIHRHRFQH